MRRVLFVAPEARTESGFSSRGTTMVSQLVLSEVISLTCEGLRGYLDPQLRRTSRGRLMRRFKRIRRGKKKIPFGLNGRDKKYCFSFQDFIL